MIRNAGIEPHVVEYLTTRHAADAEPGLADTWLVDTLLDVINFRCGMLAIQAR